MAGSILNTLRYGNRKTKRILYFMLGLAAVSVLGGLFAFLFSNVVVGLLSAVAFLVDIILLSQTNFSKLSMEEESSQTVKPVKAKKTKREKVKLEKQEKAQEERGALEWVSDEKEQKSETGKEEKEEENPLVQYDEKALKKVFVAYKVKKEHVPVMIDYCQAERISQCPAYLWKDSQYLYFLLLEKEPRMVKHPLSEVDGIHIKRGVPARPSMEYLNMREASVISSVFSQFLPNYYRVDTNSVRVEHKKNLYALAEGVWCTAASVKNMRKIVPADFYFDDMKLNLDSYSSYFRKMYISRMLYQDGVMDLVEYKDEVQETLLALADADISDEVFHTYLAQMLMKGVILQEHADFTMARRAKKRRG